MVCAFQPVHAKVLIFKMKFKYTGNRGVKKWCQEEFDSVQFGDKRLNDRFVVTASKLFRHPSSSINSASESWAEAIGAYRLFDNPSIRYQEILRVHRSKTLERMQGKSRIL